MREYLFRGKRIDTGEWEYGNLLRNKKNDVVGICNIPDDDDRISVPVVDPETVGQFTGLYDKIGNMIFEGDLITQRKFNSEEYTAVYEVVYEGESFCLKMLKGNEKAMSNGGLVSFGYYENNRLKKGEVSGNIHENKEKKGGKNE